MGQRENRLHAGLAGSMRVNAWFQQLTPDRFLPPMCSALILKQIRCPKCGKDFDSGSEEALIALRTPRAAGLGSYR